MALPKRFHKRLTELDRLLSEAASLFDEIDAEMHDRLSSASERWLESEAGQDWQEDAASIETARDRTEAARDAIAGLLHA